MNSKLLLFAVFLSIPFTTATAKSFPEKDPVLSYTAPENWTSTVAKNGNLAINSQNERVSVNFAEVSTAASMEVFEQMLPAMVKIFTDPVEVEKPKVHTEAGLTGFTATYTGKIEGNPALIIFVLFEGGKKRAVLGNMILGDPQTLPKKDDEAFKEFMNSLKGASKSADKTAGKMPVSSYPSKRPVLSYVVPGNWTSEVDSEDGSISINSENERISVNFTEAPATANMEVFEEMLPAMVEDLEDHVVAKKPEEHTEDGLTGYTATYAGKVEGKPVVAIFVLFKAGKDRSILGNMILAEPETLPKEDSEAFDGFMKSLKGYTK